MTRNTADTSNTTGGESTEHPIDGETNIPDDIVTALQNHDHVDHVAGYDDRSRLQGVMVILDWVTDEETSESGTRIINEKNYDGHIRKVNAFIRDMDGITKARGGGQSGLARYTIHVKSTT